MTRGEAEIEALLDAVDVAPDGAFRWFGRTLPAPPGTGGLVRALTRRLYDDFFCPGAPVDRPPLPTGGRGAGSGLFAESLAAAAAARTCDRPGWRLVETGAETVVVEKDGVRLRADPSAVVAMDEGGATVSVPARLRGLSPGFVTLLGSRTPEGDDDLIRLYWNLTAAAARDLVSRLSTGLEQAAIPYRLKVCEDPGGFARCDAGVLYVRAADSRGVLPLAREVAADLGRGLEPGVPALTLPLAPGLALAHDPGRGRSFGEHRCTLVAESLVRARRRGVTTPGAWLDVVRGRFAEDGVDLARPWRMAGGGR